MSHRWEFSDKIYVPFQYRIFHICVPNVYQIIRKITSFNFKIFSKLLVKKTPKTENSKSGVTEGIFFLFNGGSWGVKGLEIK